MKYLNNRNETTKAWICAICAIEVLKLIHHIIVYTTHFALCMSKRNIHILKTNHLIKYNFLFFFEVSGESIKANSFFLVLWKFLIMALNPMWIDNSKLEWLNLDAPFTYSTLHWIYLYSKCWAKRKWFKLIITSWLIKFQTPTTNLWVRIVE